ncbi:ribosomal-protein-alanine N-acetyltransferase [Paenibacillus sp. JGP012]|uniref:GNAT family N-acetyltransferase n=1 Tax=Paenibacillus sp. JGP012 TaxID=2735914 RepID=UPI00161D01DB|nr:GNAT family protein [Paenibacillus sp. JGP012]MBB6024318.1 ribosomal-protein-alanine N-acetyltransferase [Paenibacillus sp. JGP012]
MSERFTFEHFPQLDTERFRLRAADAGDSLDLLTLYSDPTVVKYMPFTPFESEQDALDEMGWYAKIFKEHSGLRWMIEDKVKRRVIGTCGYLGYEAPHHRAEIGYDLLSSCWGKGIMTEVACAVLDFGFNQMQLNKIEAKVDPGNEASVRLLHKLGFQQEGLLRQHEFEKGRYVDLAIFSKLQSDN